MRNLYFHIQQFELRNMMIDSYIHYLHSLDTLDYRYIDKFLNNPKTLNKGDLSIVDPLIFSLK